MAAKDNLNPILFNFNVELNPHEPSITVSDKGKWVGSLYWNRDSKLEKWRSGAVDTVDVDPDYQGKGIATAMWQRAQQAHQDEPWHYPEPQHSSFRTPEGDAWARSLHRKGLAGEPPDNRMEWDDENDQ